MSDFIGIGLDGMFSPPAGGGSELDNAILYQTGDALEYQTGNALLFQ